MHAIVEERWREERRGRILEAAGRVFSLRGFNHAFMDEIAAEAQVGKPTLYRYFPSKDALFAAVFGEALNDLEARLDTALEREIDLQTRFTAFIRELLPMFRRHLVPLPLLGETALAADRTMRRIFRERQTRIAGFFATAIRTANGDGEARAVDAERIGRLVIGMVWSAAASDREDRDEAVAHELADVILYGLLPRPAGADALDLASPGPAGRERRPGGHRITTGATA